MTLSSRKGGTDALEGVFSDLQDLRLAVEWRAVWVFPSLLLGGFYRPQHWQITTKVGDEVHRTAIAAVGDNLEGEKPVSC